LYLNDVDLTRKSYHIYIVDQRWINRNESSTFILFFWCVKRGSFFFYMLIWLRTYAGKTIDFEQSDCYTSKVMIVTLCDSDLVLDWWSVKQSVDTFFDRFNKKLVWETKQIVYIFNEFHMIMFITLYYKEIIITFFFCFITAIFPSFEQHDI